MEISLDFLHLLSLVEAWKKVGAAIVVQIVSKSVQKKNEKHTRISFDKYLNMIGKFCIALRLKCTLLSPKGWKFISRYS